MSLLQKQCFVIILLCFMIVPTLNALHMFQQNRYETDRYKTWIKTQFKHLKFPFKELLIALVYIALFFVSTDTRIILSGLITLVLTYLFYLNEEKRKKKQIKPLQYTARVIRQIITMVFLNVLWVLFAAFVIPNTVWNLVCLVSYWINWGFILVMAWMTTPVENLVKKYYMNLAKKILKTYPGKIVGITGSYGKTSCKNILQEVLSERFYSLMTPASFNTPMGITITIREKLKNLHEVFICEMGADHIGDIENLMNFVKPEIGVVTSIGPQHLQTFKTQENIIVEKMKMIEMLPVTGIGVLNRDNEMIREYEIKNPCKIVWYGIESDDVDYRATNIKYSANGSTFIVVDKEGNRIEFKTRLLGEHNIANILAAICVGREMQVSYEQLQDAVAKVQYVEHRLQLKKINGYTFIDDAFNSNPVGSKMSLQVLKMMNGKRFIVTPGMIDLGDKQDYYNKAFGTYMKDCADVVILVGLNQTKAIVEGLAESNFDMTHVHLCKTVKEAFDLVYQMATPQDTILLENDLPDAFNR